MQEDILKLNCTFYMRRHVGGSLRLPESERDQDLKQITGRLNILQSGCLGLSFSAFAFHSFSKRPKQIYNNWKSKMGHTFLIDESL